MNIGSVIKFNGDRSQCVVGLKIFKLIEIEFSVNFKDILYFLQGNETCEFLREIFRVIQLVII